MSRGQATRSKAERVKRPHDGGEPATRKIPVGMDGVLHIAPVRNGMVGAARGEWTEGDVFVLEYNEIARISVWTMRFVFRGDQLQLDVYGENGAFSLQGTRE